MKKSLIILLFIFLNFYEIYATTGQNLVWVAIQGQGTFCPSTSRTATYYANNNFSNVEYFNWVATNGIIRIDGVYYGSSAIEVTSNTVEVTWDDINGQGNLYVFAHGNYTWFEANRDDNHEVALVKGGNTSLATNVSELSCGSASAITATASFPNATSYTWDIVSATGSSSTNSGSNTITPDDGTSNVIIEVQANVAVCSYTAGKAIKTLHRSSPAISYIFGPSSICFGTPSVDEHYVSYNSNWNYNWNGSGYAYQTQSNPSRVKIEALSTGNKTISVTVTNQCNKSTTKTKSVTVNSGNPGYPTPNVIPYHCAGNCESYSIYPGNNAYAHEWYSPSLKPYWSDISGTSFTVCTDETFDVGYHEIWIRAKNACGYSTLDYGNQIEDCGYFLMYPNPADHEVTLVLGQDFSTSEVIIYDENKNRRKHYKVKDKKSLSMDISELSKGNYFVELKGKNKKHSEILVIK